MNEAEVLYRRAACIVQRTLGPEQQDIAAGLKCAVTVLKKQVGKELISWGFGGERCDGGASRLRSVREEPDRGIGRVAVAGVDREDQCVPWYPGMSHASGLRKVERRRPVVLPILVSGGESVS